MSAGTYYVAHRLFALHDRALGAMVAGELARQVGEEAVFLPFCDTDEETLVTNCKGRTLFELDHERLGRLAGMIAIVHGPSIDDGVCMEVGYACRQGVPVVLLTTDFQTYALAEECPEMAFPDPLLEALADSVVRVHQLAPMRATVHDRLAAFARQNLRPLRHAARTAVERLLATPMPGASCATSARCTPQLAFLESSPYQQPERWQAVAAQLDALGWQVHQATRLRPPFGLRTADLLTRARADWMARGRAELLIVDINGPETPPGAALLIGAALADGRRILAAYETRSCTFAPGREPNFRNLMIQYSISARFRRPDELPGLLQS